MGGKFEGMFGWVEMNGWRKWGVEVNGGLVGMVRSGYGLEHGMIMWLLSRAGLDWQVV